MKNSGADEAYARDGSQLRMIQQNDNTENIFNIVGTIYCYAYWIPYPRTGHRVEPTMV